MPSVSWNREPLPPLVAPLPRCGARFCKKIKVSYKQSHTFEAFLGRRLRSVISHSVWASIKRWDIHEEGSIHSYSPHCRGMQRAQAAAQRVLAAQRRTNTACNRLTTRSYSPSPLHGRRKREGGSSQLPRFRQRSQVSQDFQI